MDRNLYGLGGSGSEVLSLSARRAWIEIFHLVASSHSVTSLSARRAWIEIVPHFGIDGLHNSRSPQGERG